MRPQYEPILPLENSSFKAFIAVKTRFDYPFHYHPEYELIYILSSSGVRYVGDSFENFSENDLFMFGPDLPHCLKNSDQHTGIASALVIQWSSDLLGEGWLGRKEFAGIRHLHELAAKGIRFPQQIALQLKPILLELINETSSFEKIIKLVVALQRLSICSTFNLACQENFSNPFKSTDSERLGNIYHFLSLHYKEKITLGDMAALVCMTEESFSRFFSKLMKKTFFCFLNEYRINIACKLLIETDQQIGQVCALSGFENISFFYRQFKRFKNCSPQHYRKNMLADGAHPIDQLVNTRAV